ncbi:Helix-turn-helix domain-containing protein [Micromonospora phaseoli]|uniref:Helix-turn-helix domain-containing protein n=1 Tax=Micromonospora phaseoli TaxID=1144548 RepID=A0A1H7C4G2_9ACTN|nr:AraC family transcriptional regulator [Micromonospora phaseoli]PZV92806.1 AraC family transcriptional regulator [Micromonospora phaseoli]SEJ81510.1 Helix-turn-helix domain-containing protein [Micromonospora phaseoli]
MSSHFVDAVERSIVLMRDNLGEQLTVDDMARAAMFSKFHYTRVFQRVTGVSPGRFLSALRLQRAKSLLLSTSMNVADISVHVGYNSVGTFSSRFTRSVGLSPTEYRRREGVLRSIVRAEPDGVTPATGVVSGVVSGCSSTPLDTVFLGLFKSRIPEGRPVSCTTLTGPGRFALDGVPDGTWYLLCHALGTVPGEDGGVGPEPAAMFGCHGPFRIGPEQTLDLVVRLRPARLCDPPMLVALPDVRAVVTVRRARWSGVARAA